MQEACCLLRRNHAMSAFADLNPLPATHAEDEVDELASEDERPVVPSSRAASQRCSACHVLGHSSNDRTCSMDDAEANERRKASQCATSQHLDFRRLRLHPPQTFTALALLPNLAINSNHVRFLPREGTHVALESGLQQSQTAFEFLSGKMAPSSCLWSG
jgi:hypothetical protein